MIENLPVAIYDFFAAEIVRYGLPGVFLSSFLASLLVFVPAPYFVPVVISSLTLDPSAVAVAGALGATSAKIIIFRLSYQGRRFLSSSARKRIRPLERLVSRYGWLAAFIAASTPVPDDLVFIPLGLARYSTWKFVSVIFLGKLLLIGLMAWGSRLSIPYIYALAEASRTPAAALIATLLLVAALALSIYLITRFDWGRLLSRWFPWTVAEDSKM